MNQATPLIQDLAARLIAYENSGNKSSGKETPAVFFVFVKLQPHLAALMGNAGVRALFSRTLARANGEVSWLREMHVTTDGTVEGWDELAAQVDPEEHRHGGVVLLAHLLGLLAAFIGEDLTLGLVREVWPKLSLNN